MKGQSKLSSLTESLLNVGSGLIVSYFVWLLVIAPIWGFTLPATQIFAINMIFTVVSVIRGYLWRRFFNKRSK